MLKFIYSIIVFLFLTGSLFSQFVVTGKVTDNESKAPLIGVNISLKNSIGTSTDNSGNYIITIASKKSDTLHFYYLGYKSTAQVMNFHGKDTLKIDVFMNLKSEIIEEVVISEGRYKQKISDITSSMSLIKPELIENSNASTFETVLNKTPGVEVKDGQPSIRGGSGYSYGAGSRVLLLLDNLPILSPDAADAKWNFLPLENVSQVEIIKGASSVLYGSSALNGVINFRTAFPKDIPETKVSIMSGIYMQPLRKELIWWNKPRIFKEMSFVHLRKIKNNDLVLGGNFYNNNGYRENEHEKRERININFRHKDKSIEGLSYGVNSNFMLLDKIDFFLWQNADSGAYKQNTDAITKLLGKRLNIDPFVTYFSKNDTKHSFKSRYFYVENMYPDDSSKMSIAQSFFSEYQFFKPFENDLKLTCGISNKVSNITAKLYGNHKSNETSFYSQINKTFYNNLHLLLGIRIEQYFTDGINENLHPVFRTGVNYKLNNKINLRASFGQGYRYPSIAEKYTTASVSSLNIFPNPMLKSETGWSTEIGAYAKTKLMNWLFIFDYAAFLTRYSDMIEFTFGIYKPDSVLIPTFDDVGFKPLNVGNALISGMELSVSGIGKIGVLPVKCNLGYTYTNPINMDFTDEGNNPNYKYLKYRFLHSLKSNIQASYKKVTAGLNIVYHSKTINIDTIFIDPVIGRMILPGFDSYWENYNKSYTIFDFNILFKLGKKSTVSVYLRNCFNKEYIIRPGDIAAPRSISIKYTLKL